MYCLRCKDKEMQYMAKEKLQLGKTGWILGDLPNLLSGALTVEIYRCPSCGRLEFYSAEAENSEEDALPQRRCPACGTTHDFDYPKCPHCGYEY